jgi:hypothetical protein
MIAFFLSPIGRYVGGFLVVLVAIGGAALVIHRWLADHDAAVIAAQAALYEKTAVEARAGEEKRQADAVNAAVAAYQRRLAESQAAETQAETEREQGIADYETRLAALKRQCLANDDDVDFILRHH